MPGSYYFRVAVAPKRKAWPYVPTDASSGGGSYGAKRHKHYYKILAWITPACNTMNAIKRLADATRVFYTV